MQEDKLEEECGVIGIWNVNDFDTAGIVHLGMYGIQHRGQQSAGIAISDNGKIICHKGLGLVTEIFDEVVINHLHNGKAGLGSVGYSRAAENLTENVQPLVLRYSKGNIGISYNGCLLNADELREEFEQMGYVLQSTSDAEIITTLLARERVRQHSIEDSVIQVMKKIKGSYSFIVMTPNKLIAVRDPYGMKPLCMGKLEESYIFASETAALDTVGAVFERDVKPGELVIVTDDGIRSIHTKTTEQTALCIFEFVYLARTDSYVDGANVYESRFEAGRILARESPVHADLVIGVPDSGLPAALGYSYESKIPYAEGLIKNRYIGRTFIQPSQEIRERAVGLKLNALSSQIQGKSIILIDDSIVRGTTSKKIVQMLKERGGAKEVHMRISSPPVKFPCHYGIDTPDKEVLIANQMSLDDIAELIGADSLEFISQEGLLETPIGAKCNFCSACFTGRYPLDGIKANIEGGK